MLYPLFWIHFFKLISFKLVCFYIRNQFINDINQLHYRSFKMNFKNKYQYLLSVQNIHHWFEKKRIVYNCYRKSPFYVQFIKKAQNLLNSCLSTYIVIKVTAKLNHYLYFEVIFIPQSRHDQIKKGIFFLHTFIFIFI